MRRPPKPDRSPRPRRRDESRPAHEAQTARKAQTGRKSQTAHEAQTARKAPSGRRFLVTSAPGLEGLLVAELAELGLHPRLESSGAVVVAGSWAEAARILVRSRIASRVFLSLRRAACLNRAMLYDQVRRIDWPSLFPPDRTMSVSAHGSPQGADFKLSYAPLRIKDAVCDEFRKRGFPRPNVDRRDPDVRLQAFLFGGRIELSVDLAGRALHRRGYRREGAEAPLRENRAAALLRFAGYDGSRPMVDPFCGSGTIPIEAALIATRTAPGLLRRPEEFALALLFPDALATLRREHEAAAKERRERPPHSVRGSDLSAEALAIARANAERAGVSASVSFEQGDARSLTAPGSWIVTNPPYGERLEDPEAAAELIRAFTHRVKHHAVGARLAMVVPRGALEKSVGLKPDARLAVESGPLKLRYLSYEIQEGRFERGARD